MSLAAVVLSAEAGFAAKPAAIMGFGTDVKALCEDVLRPARYEYVDLTDGWVEPKDYGKYGVLYFGEKLRGAAQDKNWISGEAREAAEKFIADGGTVILGGEWMTRQLFGKPKRGAVDPLVAKVKVVERSLGRVKANYARAKKSLGYADDVGDWVLTAEGRDVKALTDEYAALFASVKDLAKLPELERWEPKPLGAPGDLKLPTAFAKKPEFRAKPVLRPGLVLFGDGMDAVVVVRPADGKYILSLAEELAWHLAQMIGREVAVVKAVPTDGRPALVVQPFEGKNCRAVVKREKNVILIGGEDAGASHAVTYVLEALGCRYLWPGPTGKVIPKRDRVVLPEIALDAESPFVVRRMRLYDRGTAVDHEGNRDFFKWHGLNDNKFMTDTKPGDADGFEWGHYYKDYYRKYAKSKPRLFALQPDGTRELHLGSHPERPTFCLSNPELAEITARNKIAEFRAKPTKKALSICLPDGATSSWCLCEECRKMDPSNAAHGGVTVFFPKRSQVDYVAMTDRVFAYMNRVCELVAKEFPDRLLSTYAYSCYTAAPVRTKPHPNLLILSVAGNYADASAAGEAQRNLAQWMSFGNRVLWRPNMSAGFRVNAPQNYARHAFEDVSAMAANGVFGTDFDTMYNEWATKGIGYYFTAKAHFNPDRLGYDALLDDFCEAGFAAAAKPVRTYFDALERATDAAAKLNAEDKEPAVGWVQRQRRWNRIFETLDFDALDRCLADARAAVKGDAVIEARLARLQFANDLGRWTKRLNGALDEPEKAKYRAFVADYLARDPSAYNPQKCVVK